MDEQQTIEDSAIDLMTPQDVAAALAITMRDVRRMRDAKRGPDWLRLSHKTVRYRRKDVEAWLERCRHEGGQ